MARIKDLIGSAVNGVWGDEPNEDGHDVTCVRAADFDRTALTVRKEKLPLRSLDSRARTKHLLRLGDLVWEKSGGGETQPVGLAVRFDLTEPAVCSNFCTRITPSSGTDSRYLAYVFAAAYAIGLNQRSIKQTTGLQNLDGGSFLAEPWPVPDTEEQRRIADFLDAQVDTLIRSSTLLSRQIELVGAREASQLEGIFRLQAADSAPVRRLVSKLTSGPRAWGEYVGETGIPFVRIANIPRRGIRLRLDNLSFADVPASAERERTLTRVDDVVISITADIGSIGIIPEEVAGGNVSQHVALLRAAPERCRPAWLAYMLKAPATKALLTMSSYGGTKVGLGLADVANVNIPLPPVSEQDRLVREIDDAMNWDDAMLASLTRKKQLLAERRQALITAAVTGQIDVTTARGLD
jgi:type I restriction enzyme S subunit